MRLLEDHKFRQEETNWKTDKKGNDISRNIAGHIDLADADHLVVQEIIITDKIDEKPKQGYTAAAGQVPERL